MVAAYATSDRQPLPRGRDVGRILRYCQTRIRSNTSRDTFRYASYAFVFPITRQTRARSQRTNSWPPGSSLLRDRPVDETLDGPGLSIVLKSTGLVASVPVPGASDPIRTSHTGSKLRWLVGRSRQSVRRTVSPGSNSASNGGMRRRRRVPAKRSGNLIFSRAGKRRSTSSTVKAPSSWTVIRC